MTEFQEQIINANENQVIKPEGLVNLEVIKTKSFIVGRKYIQSIIQINTSNIKIDGGSAKIVLTLDDIQNDLCLFKIREGLRNVELLNMNIEINYKGQNTNFNLYAMFNNSHSFKLINCKITFRAEKQINFTTVYNDSGLNTHLDTPADCLVIENCRLFANINCNEFPYESSLIGVHNNFANSISVSNNYIFVQNIGNGERQKAYGIINSGRFARIENNNIKANGSHNIGKLLEQAHSYGVYNTGLYMVFTGNNCVGEWGGKSVGLYNSGNYANITANKVLATHTIMGRTVILDAEHCILSNNIITSTSRNPHFVDVLAGNNIISGNYMQGLSGWNDDRSGCGILVKGQADRKIRICNISDNIISSARDFGIILLNTEKNNISGNQLIKFTDIEDYIPVYAENSSDKISENIADGKMSINSGELRDKLLQNYDEAVESLRD